MPEYDPYEEWLGNQLADLLHLRKTGPTKRYQTLWGDKTAHGLALTIRRVIAEHDEQLKKGKRKEPP